MEPPRGRTASGRLGIPIAIQRLSRTFCIVGTPQEYVPVNGRQRKRSRALEVLLPPLPIAVPRKSCDVPPKSPATKRLNHRNYSLYTTSARILLANYCYSSLGSPVTNVASVPSLTTGPLPTNAPLITLQPSKAANAIVYADVIQIHWRSNNTDVVQLMSGVAASGSAVSATPGTSPTTTPYSTTNLVTYSPTTSPSSSTLSSGARAGVGVGVALGVIALLALIAFVLFQGKRRKASQPHPAAAAYQGDIPGVQEHSDKKPAEIDAPVDIKAAEMDAPVGTKLAEMDTHVDATRPAEMEAREIKELRGSKVAADVEST